jgi:hypothetical protein
VLRRVFGHLREEVIGGGGGGGGGQLGLHNKELHNLHSSQNIIRIIK